MTAQVGCNTRSITSANSQVPCTIDTGDQRLHWRLLCYIRSTLSTFLPAATPARVVVAGCGNRNLAMNNRNSFVNLINLMRFMLVLTLFMVSMHGITPVPTQPPLLQDLYGVRSDLGNLYKALGRLEEAKVRTCAHVCVCVSVESPFSH